MPVRVVHVGHVRVPVPLALVSMPMRVWLAERVVRTVFVLMVFIVHVRVRVRHWRVLVLMFVELGHVQPDAARHQEPGCRKLHRKGLV